MEIYLLSDPGYSHGDWLWLTCPSPPRTLGAGDLSVTATAPASYSVSATTPASYSVTATTTASYEVTPM